MLVVLLNNQVLDPQSICQSCPLADQAGQPRWRKGELKCGHEVGPLATDAPRQYECRMGFRIASVS